jgi:uncharacterized protein (DUF4213/DUF364 family)
MEILKSILNSLGEDAPIEEVRRGLHWNAVISKQCGLSSTLSQDASCCSGEEQDLPAPKSSFTEMTALELAQFSLSTDITKASLGIAAINSLVDVEVEKCADLDGLQLVHDLAQEKNVSVIGHFPFLERLSGVAKNLWIIEKHPRPGDIGEDAGKDYLPKSDIVVISGTTLINHTLPGILDLCNEKSVRMLLGPSTVMAPTLFDFGIDILSGSVVTDRETALKHIGEGANFVRLKRTGAVRFVTMVKDREQMVKKLENS